MVGAIHNEFHPGCNHAKFANNEFVARKIKMIFYISFEILHVVEIVVVSKIAYFDVWVPDDIFQKKQAVIIGQREAGGHFELTDDR